MTEEETLCYYGQWEKLEELFPNPFYYDFDFQEITKNEN
mgnify:FL=1